jgi:hypothetical protein
LQDRGSGAPIQAPSSRGGSSPGASGASSSARR